MNADTAVLVNNSNNGHPAIDHPGLGVSRDTLNPQILNNSNSTINDSINASLAKLDDFRGDSEHGDNDHTSAVDEVDEEIAGDDIDDLDPGGTGTGAPIPRVIQDEPGFLAAFSNKFNQLLLQK